MYKLVKTHVVIGALLRLSNITEPIGVHNQTTDPNLLYMFYMPYICFIQGLNG
jgi:hypothetical protein